MPNSDNKRRGAGNIPGWVIVYPVPDGTIDDGDRMQATGLYPLGAASAASTVPAVSASLVVSGGQFGHLRYAVRVAEYAAAEDELAVLLW